MGGTGGRVRVVAIVFARNEEDSIGDVIDSLRGQSVPVDVIVVDDQSTDRTAEVARARGALVIESPYHHEESWVVRPELARLPNLALEYIYEKGLDYEYFLVVGGDTVLDDSRYVEKLLECMEKHGCAVSSGIIEGEPEPEIPRGSGRLHDFRWFRSTLRFYPEIYGWEAYTVYKALATGQKACISRDAKIRVERPTRLVKPEYGFNMRVLGYYPPYAILRSIYYMRYSPAQALKMLYYYLKALLTMNVYDEEVAKTLRAIQKEKLLARLTPSGKRGTTANTTIKDNCKIIRVTR